MDLDDTKGKEIADLLGAAFEHDPGFQTSARATGERGRRRIHAILEASLSMHLAGRNRVRGVYHDGRLVAVACVRSPDGSLPKWAAVGALSRLAWVAGPGVLFRVLRRSLPTYSQHPSEPHHFLAKLAVHPAYQRRGLARALLEDLHDWSAESGSAGVALDNGNPENVPFYESFGYRVTHHARIADMELWWMFRPNDPTEKPGSTEDGQPPQGKGKG
ncbi:MAG: GNAT family N-acetyltransferase [Gemmatimonadetes bacterium]|nr:GNAT family N-acetyltransferase [Gemmatimonadota bacterium]